MLKSKKVSAPPSVYINKIPMGRIFNVWHQFAGAIILFYITGLLRGSRYSMQMVLKALTGWESIGNSNWYIFCILCCYIFVYISFKLFKNNDEAALLFMFILCCSYILILKGQAKDQWWYDTILAYPAGMAYAKHKVTIERYILKNNMMYIVAVMVTSCLGYITFHQRSKFVFFEGLCICFCAFLILLTSKLQIGNKVCRFLGKYAFEIYILQRIPMLLLQQTVKEKYLYLLLCFAFTILLSVLFHGIYIRMDKRAKIILSNHKTL